MDAVDKGMLIAVGLFVSVLALSFVGTLVGARIFTCERGHHHWLFVKTESVIRVGEYLAEYTEVYQCLNCGLEKRDRRIAYL